MLQRSFLPEVPATRHTPPTRTARVLGRATRRAMIPIAASLAVATFAACSSLQPRAAFDGARYASLAPVSPSVAFAPRPTGNTFAEAPLYARNIAIGDSTIAATIVRLRRYSPAFDSAMVAIERSGIPVVIGTARQLRDQLPPGYGHVSGWQALTAFYPLTPTNAPGRRIEHIAVIVRLTSLASAMRAGGRTPQDSLLFDRYLERVLGHEIYGHVMPQLQMGRTAPIVCDDPTSGADWYSACVMRRERLVMAQVSAAQGTFVMAATK